MLTLAIAETTVMSDVSAAVERLEEIKQLGVRIAIDDFGGSGYAYHSDLRRLPLDFLKVDRGSLAASEDEDYRTWLLEAILIVGRDLSLTVIAKGIESYEQMSALQGDGLHDGAGHADGQSGAGERHRQRARREAAGDARRHARAVPRHARRVARDTPERSGRESADAKGLRPWLSARACPRRSPTGSRICGR